MTPNGRTNDDIPIQTRIILLERDIELLKIRDTEFRSLQEKMSSAYYKLDTFERSLNDHRERLDEVKEVFQEVKKDIIKKIDDSFAAKAKDEKPKPNDKTDLLNNIAKILLAIITIAASAIFGIKSLGG